MIFPTISINLERWKWNKTFEVYVSTKGRVKNRSKELVPPNVCKNGYMAIYIPYLHKLVLLHRLVMLTWQPRTDAEFLTVDHIDHNLRNNSIYNLEWVTKEENKRRAERDYIDIDLRKVNKNKKKNIVQLNNRVIISKDDEELYELTSNELDSKAFKSFCANRRINYDVAKKIAHDLFYGIINQGTKNKFGMIFTLVKE